MAAHASLLAPSIVIWQALTLLGCVSFDFVVARCSDFKLDGDPHAMKCDELQEQALTDGTR